MIIKVRKEYAAIIEVRSTLFHNIMKQGKVNCRKIEENNRYVQNIIEIIIKREKVSERTVTI